jgi:hypothetical protein
MANTFNQRARYNRAFRSVCIKWASLRSRTRKFTLPITQKELHEAVGTGTMQGTREIKCAMRMLPVCCRVALEIVWACEIIHKSYIIYRIYKVEHLKMAARGTYFALKCEPCSGMSRGAKRGALERPGSICRVLEAALFSIVFPRGAPSLRLTKGVCHTRQLLLHSFPVRLLEKR